MTAKPSFFRYSLVWFYFCSLKATATALWVISFKFINKRWILRIWRLWFLGHRLFIIHYLLLSNMRRNNLQFLLEIFVFAVFIDLFLALNQLLMLRAFNFRIRIMFIFGDLLLIDSELFLHSLLLYRHWVLV